MRSSFSSFSRVFRIALAFIFLGGCIQFVNALTYPVSTPPGEVAGGTYRTYFDNMFFNVCPTGQTIHGFSSSGVPNCISAGAALSISGALGYTLYHNGTDWVSSANIYNSGTYVGIGTSTPGAKLEVNGGIKAGGNYYNVISWNQNGTPVNGVKIKTRIPYTNGSQMPLVSIEGYDYGNGSPIGISLVWYVYSGSFMNYKASSWGNITPPITLANESGYVTIHLGWTPYYARFSVRAYAQGMTEQPSWFTGWSVADEVAGTTNAVVVGYNNRFPGVVNFASGIWNSNGRVGIGTTSPTAQLEVAGQIKITGGAPGTGRILTSDSTGLARWSLTSPLPCVVSGGYGNQCYGSGAIASNTTGYQNSAFGDESMLSNTTGYQNSAFGYRSLANATSSARNSAFGFQALENTTTWDNVGIGTQALRSNVDGIGNVAVGNYALYKGVSTGYNVAVGIGALQENTNGNSNVGIGFHALLFNTDGYINTAVGRSALESNTVGYNNSAFGFQTLWQNTSGFSNTAYGSMSMANNVTGTYNTALGVTSLNSNSAGYLNTAIGLSALLRNSSGYENTAVGAYALQSNSTGLANTAVGYLALSSGISSANTALGYAAGMYLTGTSSDGNTFLGYYAGSNLIAGVNNIALGVNTTFYSSTGSNQLNIGNWIYGNGGNIGIGTNSPGAKLEVAGQIKITGGSPGAGKILTSDASGLASWSSTVPGVSATGVTGGVQNYVTKFGTGGIGLYASQIYDNGSNVGIGTGTATKKLTVDSNTVNDSGLRLARISSSSTAYTGAAMGLGVDANGNVIPISNGDVVVYDGINRATPPTPDPNVAGRQISYDFNNFFDIPTKQSFVVSDGSSASRNGPYFKENGSSALCSWNGTYGASAYDCATADPVTGLSASPYNSFTMTAKGSTFGYQIALGARGDAPLFARSGRFNGAVGGGLYTNDSPYQTPAPWQKVLTVPANHPEYLYINTGLNSQLQSQTGGGNVGIGTTFPNSRFEVWTGATTSPLIHFRGANNVAMGLGALNPNITGNANAAFGAEALYSITTGYSNAAIGYRALRTNAGGYNNVAFGQESLYSNNGGTWNSAIGYQALYSNSSGTGNIAFGPQALYNLSTGNNNIAIGYQAARVVAGSSVSRNIAIGYQSLYSSTASDLVAIGNKALYANTSGTGNTAIGYMSLDSVTTTSNNTAVGYNSLGATTGANNTAVGNSAASNLTSGSNNIAIGNGVQLTVATGSSQLNIGNWIYGNGGNIGIGTATNLTKKLTVNGDALINFMTVGRGPITASNNTIVGQNALDLVTTGGYNTAIGAFSLYSNLDGNNNISMGASALFSNVSGWQNVAIGSQALYNNQGYSNVAIGYLGLQNNINGNYNTAIGERALLNNTDGNNNIGIGYNAGVFASGAGSATGSNNIFIGNNIILSSASASNQLNIGNWIYGNGGNIGIGTGSNLFAKLTVAGDSLINGITVGRGGGDNSKNTVFGYSALLSNTTGYFNTAIGVQALLSNTTGYFNTAIGVQALENNTTGSRNTAIGFFALNHNTVAYFNTAIGDQALENNTTGGFNTAIGSMALNVNTIGEYNTAIGQAASARNTTGSNNAAVGRGALGNNFTGSSNTAMGGYALSKNIYGDYNTALGYYAGSGLTTGSGNIAIGYNTSFPSNTGSNQLNIGNWIYGNGGNIGIGTSTPTSKLDVSGTFELGTNGTQLNAIIKASPTLDVPSIAAGVCSVQTLTVTNAVVGGVPTVSPANALTDRMIIAYARVSAANTIEVKFCNVSAAAIDLPSMTYYVSVIQ